MENLSFTLQASLLPTLVTLAHSCRGKCNPLKQLKASRVVLWSLSPLPAIHRHPVPVDFSNVASQRHSPGSWLEHLCIANQQTSFHTRRCILI